MVSDVNNSSLQLVQMCERVWSPVCDKNWTLQDAIVVCRELDNQGLLKYRSSLITSFCLVIFICYIYIDDTVQLGWNYVALLYDNLLFGTYLTFQLALT